jgi:hypothetical protein
MQQGWHIEGGTWADLPMAPRDGLPMEGSWLLGSPMEGPPGLDPPMHMALEDRLPREDFVLLVMPTETDPG